VHYSAAVKELTCEGHLLDNDFIIDPSSRIDRRRILTTFSANMRVGQSRNKLKKAIFDLSVGSDHNNCNQLNN
jgi:hypothetical protein